MRHLIKVILLFALFGSDVFANLPKIDECKTDLYYANGILMEDTELKARRNWQLKVIKLFANNLESYQKLDRVDVAYNHSSGVVSDLFESFIQKTEAEPGYKVTWEAFKLFVGLKLKHADDLLALAEQVNNSIEGFDLSVQVEAYKNSIKNGHGVIVISHSQGNLFTNRAYARLEGWMKPYFYNMGVATPAHEVASDGPYITFDNDPIHYIPNSLDDNLYNGNRYYSHTNALGERFEALTGAFHAFDYYLGSPALINNVNVSTSKAAEKIQSFIIEKIQAHLTAKSQWELDQELNKGTKDFKITLKHRFDTTITSMQDVEVYPFKASAKLYHVKDNTLDGNGWVKASCGGEEVFNSWPTQKEGEEYLINNPKEEIILSQVIPKVIGIKFNINRANTQYHTGRIPMMIPSNMSDLDKLLSSSYGNSPDSTLAVIYTVSYNTSTDAHGFISHDFFNPTFTGSYYKLKEHNFNTSYRVMTFRTYSKEHMDKYPLYFYINNESINIHSIFIDKYNFDFSNTRTLMVGALIDYYDYYQPYINASYNFKEIDLKI